MKDTVDILLLGFSAWFGLVVTGQFVNRFAENAVMEAEDSYRQTSPGPDPGVSPDLSPDRADTRDPVQEQPKPVSPVAPVKPAAPAVLRAHATLALASEASIKSNRPILVMFIGAPGTCPKCDQMKRVTLASRTVIDRLNSHFEFVVVDGAANPVLADQFDVKEYPTFAVAWPTESRANKFIPATDPITFLEDVSFAQKGRGE